MNSLNLRWMLWMALGLVRVGAETPDLLSLAWTNGRPILEFRLVPSASEYRVRSSASPGAVGTLLGGSHRGGRWTAEAPSVGDSAFYRLEALILSNETVRASTLLNRIAYGPTPDELDRLAAIGRRNGRTDLSHAVWAIRSNCACQIEKRIKRCHFDR